MYESIRVLAHIWFRRLRGQKKFLYIPYEILQREIHGGLILSDVAQRTGFVVLLGQKQDVFPLIPFLPSGVVFLKSVVPGELKLQQAICESGHFNVSLDIEGLTMSNGLSGIYLRYSSASIALADKLFFWGNTQLENVVAAIPSAREKSVVTGSPVADWWGLQSKAVDEEKRPTILFATSFPIANHPMGIEYYSQSLKAAAPRAAEEQKNDFSNDAALQIAVFPAYKALLQKLAIALPFTKILLRPHPTEEKEVWQEIAQSFENIEISTEHDIGFYLNQSDLFLHFNSTTAIQSAIQGVPSVSLLPSEVSDAMRNRMSEPVRLVTSEYQNHEDLIEAIRLNLIKRNALPTRDIRKVSGFLDFKQGQYDYSSTKIIAEIENLYHEQTEYQPIDARNRFSSLLPLTLKPLMVVNLQKLSMIVPASTPVIGKWRKSAEYGLLKTNSMHGYKTEMVINDIRRRGNASFALRAFKVYGKNMFFFG
jgi:surface carbohydrate biosynthesis protein